MGHELGLELVIFFLVGEGKGLWVARSELVPDKGRFGESVIESVLANGYGGGRVDYDESDKSGVVPVARKGESSFVVV